jgi:uncharacterized protein (TIGR00725 family)
VAVIGVIGGSECSERGRALAREVGALIARGGDILICGGRTGVMEAACEGARSMGGVTVGVLPGTDRREANLFVTVPIATGLGVARNAIIARAADALIAVEGSYGTLSELAYALGMGKTVVCLESWELARCGGTHERLLPAGTPEEAYALAKAALPPE